MPSKKLIPQPFQNGGVNGFTIDIDDDETIDEERFFPIAIVGVGKQILYYTIRNSGQFNIETGKELVPKVSTFLSINAIKELMTNL